MVKKGVLNRVGAIVRGKDFFGREKFVDLVWQKILHGNIILAAPRRFGKTSVMYRLIDEPRYESKVVHADLESVSDPAEMIIRLIEGLAKDEAFEDSVGKLGFIKESWQFFRKHFQEVDLHVAKVKLRDEITEEWQSRGSELFQKIAENDAIVIFILDEFPMMLEAMLRKGLRDEAKTLLRWFRSIRLSPELQNKIRFVVAGSIGIDQVLSQLDEIASINDFEKLKLEPFAPKVARDFLDELCNSHKLRISRDVKEKMLDTIGTPIPFFIQVMFSEIHKSHFQDEQKITPELVDKIYRDKVLGMDCKSHFLHYYDRLRQYYEPDEERAARRILRDIAISGSLKRSTCFQIFNEVIGATATPERFGELMGELENDFYVALVYETDSYEFGSKLLRDWWLRHYGMMVD